VIRRRVTDSNRKMRLDTANSIWVWLSRTLEAISKINASRKKSWVDGL